MQDEHSYSSGGSQAAFPYSINPFFASLLPKLTEPARAALKSAILQHGGCLAPLVAWKEANQLIDGHHRHALVAELRGEGHKIVNPVIVYKSFKSRWDAAKWVFENWRGTHPGYSVYGLGKSVLQNKELVKAYEQAAHKRMKDGKPVSSAEKGSTLQKLGKEIGLGQTTLYEIKMVLAHPDVDAAIERGEITYHSAFKNLASMKSHQRSVVRSQKALRALPDYGDDALKTIILGDSLQQLHKLPDNSISLIFTSPPYPLKSVHYPNWSYDGDYPKYLAWLYDVWTECKRVLRPGGKLILNFDNVNIPKEDRVDHKVRHDLRRDFANHMGELETIFMDEYLWSKQNAVGSRPTIGTKGSPAGHRVNNNCEYVCVWAKERTTLDPERTEFSPEEQNDLLTDDQYRWSMMFWEETEQSTEAWKIKPASRPKNKHVASFPLELAERIVRLYSFVGDTVLDPFCGSGTTVTAAAKWGRKFIGFDNCSKFVNFARRRVKAAMAERKKLSKKPITKPPLRPLSMKKIRNREKMIAIQRSRILDATPCRKAG